MIWNFRNVINGKVCKDFKCIDIRQGKNLRNKYLCNNVHFSSLGYQFYLLIYLLAYERILKKKKNSTHFPPYIFWKGFLIGLLSFQHLFSKSSDLPFSFIYTFLPVLIGFLNNQGLLWETLIFFYRQRVTIVAAKYNLKKDFKI